MATPIKNVKVKTEDPESWDIVSENSSTVDVAEEASSVRSASPKAPVVEDVATNPVGQLQELCVLRNWTIPKYEDGPRSGLDHLPTFTIHCRLNGYTTSASGANKKKAKKAAAARMLSKVANDKPTPTRTLRAVPNELSDLENYINRLNINDGALVPVSATEVEDKLSSLAKKADVDLVSRAGSDIGGRSVWICELDGDVITGYGKTPSEARCDAAKTVLHRLQMKIQNA